MWANEQRINVYLDIVIYKVANLTYLLVNLFCLNIIKTKSYFDETIKNLILFIKIFRFNTLK